MIQLQIRKPKAVKTYPDSYILRFCKNPECKRPFYTRTKKSHVLPAGVKRYNAVTCCRQCSYLYHLEYNRLKAKTYNDRKKKPVV